LGSDTNIAQNSINSNKKHLLLLKNGYKTLSSVSNIVSSNMSTNHQLNLNINPNKSVIHSGKMLLPVIHSVIRKKVSARYGNNWVLKDQLNS
jgi:hypothetical protein